MARQSLAWTLFCFCGLTLFMGVVLFAFSDSVRANEKSPVQVDAQAKETDVKLQKQIDALIKQLGDNDDFKKREAAQQELIKIGVSVLPAVEKAMADTKDDEIKHRLPDVVKGILQQTTNTGFPDDKIILIATLMGKNIDHVVHIIHGGGMGYEVRFIKKDTLRYKEDISPHYVDMTEQDATYVIMYIRSGNNKILQKTITDKIDSELKIGSKYLIIIPKSVPTVLSGGCTMSMEDSFFNANIIVLEYNMETLKQINKMPDTLKEINKLMAQFGGKDESQKESARKELLKIGKLAERPLVGELNNPDANIKCGVALTLIEMGNIGAIPVLINNIDSPEPLKQYRAITALGKMKGLLSSSGLLTAQIGEKLVKILDNDKEYEEKSLNLKYKLSDSAFSALNNMTGKEFGKNKEKWNQWIKEEHDNICGQYAK